ncbi:MAG: ThiF family adenylyltransferase [Thermoplasmata archaeon]|nr:ThiF family adenylyltransferase [Thermoplasmata archaeon]
MVEECIAPGDVDEDKFDRARRIDWLDIDAIARVRVLMVGAGAIGNEVGKNLILSGFKDMTVVDMDRVVHSNLARCLFFSDADAVDRRFKAKIVADSMSALGTDLKVKPIIGTIQEQGEKFIKKFDIVFGCLDNVLARLHVNSQCCFHGVPYIDGAMDGFNGKVQVILPIQGPCLECGMNDSHAKIVEQRFSCTGNDISLFLPKIGAEITTTSIVGAMMVREALKLASGKSEFCINNVIYYSGQRNSLDELDISIQKDCPNHKFER